MPNFHCAAIAFVLAVVACGSSDEQPSSDPGAPPPTTTAEGGVDRGSDGGPPSTVDAAAKDGSSAQAGVPNAEFEATLRAFAIFETSFPLASPSADAKWTVLAVIGDVPKNKVYPDVTVLAGPGGAKAAIPFLAPSGNRLNDAFPGPQTGFDVDMDRGAASLHGAHVDCPAFHTYTWTVTPQMDGQEKHVVSWSPSGEPDVVVAIGGSIDRQLGLPNSGTHAWTQAAGSPGRFVQVNRSKSKTFGMSAVLECFVRVNKTL